jgi:glycosyltransferase involved in cell wall biosynthesis
MKLSFLIPFRDADGSRTPGHQWLLKRWRHFWPDAEFCIAPDDGMEPFNKSLAVNNAALQASGDIYIVLDADTWVEPMWIEEALERIAKGIPWVIPVHKNMRLKKEFSEQLMALPPTLPSWSREAHMAGKRTLPPITMAQSETHGPVVGFCHVMPRQAFEAVGGYDERIRGWGGEDTSFTWAMDIVNGHHRKLHGIAMCLWHARPRDEKNNRIWIGQDRKLEADKKRVVSAYNRALLGQTGSSRKEAMLKALER